MYLFWPHWVFVPSGFSLVAVSRGLLCSCGVRACHGGDVPCCRVQALEQRAWVTVARGLSSCSSQALEHRFNSCGTQAWLLWACGIFPDQELSPWTVVLEKTLESPFNCKEIHPKGDQSWVFIGRTDAEAEAPILRPPDRKNWLIGKDPDAVKDWRREEKGMTKDEMVGWHHRLNGHGFG